jgi:hypothetical protein
MNLNVSYRYRVITNTGSSTVKVPLWCGMYIVEEAMSIWKQEGYENFLCFKFNFSVVLKFF